MPLQKAVEHVKLIPEIRHNAAGHLVDQRPELSVPLIGPLDELHDLEAVLGEGGLDLPELNFPLLQPLAFHRLLVAGVDQFVFLHGHDTPVHYWNRQQQLIGTSRPGL